MRRAASGALGGLGGTLVLTGFRQVLTAAGLVGVTAPEQVIARLEDDLSTDPVVKLRGMTEYWCTRNDKSMDGLPGTKRSIRPTAKGGSASGSWIGGIKSAGVASEFSAGVLVGLLVASVSYVAMRGSLSSVLTLLNV